MRRLVVGLVMGAAVGVGSTYLVLRWPGPGSPASLVAVDAGVATDAQAHSRRRTGKRSRPTRPAAAAPSAVEGVDTEGAATAEEAPLPELSARDREALWRGPAIATPTRRLDLGGARDGRPLAQDEIDRGIRSNAAAVTACVREARGDAPLAGTVTLEFLVEADGRATRSRARAPRYLLDHGLLACVQRAVRGMRFAVTGAPTIVTVPFEVR